MKLNDPKFNENSLSLMKGGFQEYHHQRNKFYNNEHLNLGSRLKITTKDHKPSNPNSRKYTQNPILIYPPSNKILS